MIDYIRHHLGVKLLLSYIAILVVIVIVMVIVIPFSAPYAYNHFMMETGLLPKPLKNTAIFCASLKPRNA